MSPVGENGGETFLREWQGLFGPTNEFLVTILGPRETGNKPGSFNLGNFRISSRAKGLERFWVLGQVNQR